MLRHPWLHTLLDRLRSRRLGWEHLALSVAVGAGAFLVGVGLVVLAVTWRDSRVHRPDADSSAAAEQATAVSGQAGSTERVLTGANAEEVVRRLAEAPTERWAYALRAADRRPPPSMRPGNDPLAGSDPHPAPPVIRRVVPAVPASALGFAWPLLNGVISSPFGDEHPLGIDIAPVDSLGLVLAARDGVVLYAGGDPCCSYGYYVILDHGDGLTSIYGHFRELPYVEAGEQIERGTVLGVAGDTGHAFGVHLHFEVRLNGIPVDPQEVLTGGQLTPLPVRVPPRPSPEPSPSPVPLAVEEPGPSPSESPEPQGLGREPAPTEAPADPTAAATADDPAPGPETPAPETSTPEATATAEPTPTTPRTLRPTSTPTSTPLTATPTVTPSPTPAPTPSPSPTPSPTPTPIPCETVRLPMPGQQAPSGFITLEATPDSVTSLIAQRCAANEPAVVIAKPLPERNCMAVLADKTGTQSKRLIPVPTPTPTPGPAAAQSPAEVRWVIPAADLTPGAVLRVSCVEPADSLDP